MFTQILNSLVVVLSLVGVLTGTALAVIPVQVPRIIGTPGVHGDQLFFFFDARTNRVPFLSISNMSHVGLKLEIVFYSQDLSQELALEWKDVGPYQNIVLDPASMDFVKNNAGLAVVTPVAGSPLRPVVPAGGGANDSTPPLFGAFTLANTELGAGFGQNPLARVAVDESGLRPAGGTIVDGKTVRYQQIAPDTLVVPTYFRPSDLSPASKDGNRIILAVFKDSYGPDFRIQPDTMKFDAFFDDAGGSTAARNTDVEVRGVRFDTLQGLAGNKTLTKSGKISFEALIAPSENTNFFGLVSQALGTFSIGQRMPGVFFDSDRTPGKIVFAATPIQNAALGGLKGADSICQQDAKAAGLPGTYLAWMSDSTQSPSTRFTKSTLPYFLPNGARIADDWDDLTDGYLSRVMLVTADGKRAAQRFAFTNTDSMGRGITSDPARSCDDWTSSSSAKDTIVGDNYSIADWSTGDVARCSSSSVGLLCFQQ